MSSIVPSEAQPTKTTLPLGEVAAQQPERADLRCIALHAIAWPSIIVALTIAFAHSPAFQRLAPDYIQFWSAGRILTSGGNPYDPASQSAENAACGWRRDVEGLGRYDYLPYYYPPWLALALAPLTALNFAQAKAAWLAILFTSVAASAYLVRERLARWHPVWGTVLWLTFGVWLTTLPIGQIAPLVVLLIAALWRLADAGWNRTAGVILFCLSIKVQLTLVVALAVFVWAVRQRRWQLLAGGVLFGASVIAVCTTLCPDWLPAMLDAPRVTPLVTEQKPWLGVTWFCLLRTLGLSGGWLAAGYATFALPAIGFVALRAWQRSVDLFELIALACCVTPLVAPYARYYDLPLLLFPLVAIGGSSLSASKRTLLGFTFAIVPLAIWIVYPGEASPLVSQLEWLWMPATLAAFFAGAWAGADAKNGRLLAGCVRT